MWKNCEATILIEQSPLRFPAYIGNRYWRRTKLRTSRRGQRSRLRSAIRRDIVIQTH
ncbi:MAG: hypothetical protein AB7V39_02190 [Nitrospiraceae bacterium]